MLCACLTIMDGQMPKYRYACDLCLKEWWEWMSMKDPSPQECPHCETGKPYKVPTKFVTMGNKPSGKKTAKENVIDHIEENREILKQMKTEPRENK